ncbi:hypothetical protein SAMN05660865_01387 [Caloramator fervidus]|uniref:Amidohydrolase 3 domain-containing protein n=1 Tax=Caloramator fervidus TaxID=29344 RepID=A0A1H5W5L1_9CLOT|nr:amidohydrolase [Caloramator fervidus]SEF94628.1 hypothetical protein SAMN05660865_01387 [Caloramator fervidus]
MKQLLFTNASIYTMDENDSVFDSMLVQNGKILKLGKYKDLKENFKGEIFDLEGKTVLPGFIESHIHLIEAARSVVDLNLKNVKTKEEFEILLKKYSKNAWVIGSGWNEEIFGGKMPNRFDIDKIVQDKPVCLVRQDGHSLVLNTAALKELNLHSKAVTSQNAIKDEKGLTGLFYEEWVFDILGLIMDKVGDEYLEMALICLENELFKSGITMVNDIMTQYPRYFNLYKKLQNEGNLKIRIVAGALGKSRELDEFINLEDGERIKKGPCKYFMDGSFGSKTAMLIDGYEDEPENKGIQTLKDEEIYSIVENSLKNNVPLAVHAIGDLALKKFLDIYEKVYSLYPNDKVRNRVEHIQIIREEDIDRFKKLNLIASFQPIFNLEKDLTLSRVGLRRIKDTYRFKTFIEKGIKVIFNSDTPFGAAVMTKKDGTYFRGFEPLLGIYCAVDDINLNKEENVTIKQAIECYTKNPSYANYMENIYGSLEKGKYADFVVLEENIFKVKPSDIKDIEVFMTVVNGEVVYKR